MTASAVILVVQGLLGVVYAPFLAGGAAWMFLGLGISAYTIVGVLHLAAGIGLLRLWVWARAAAAILAAGGLVFLHAPALLAAVGSGALPSIDWLGIAGSVVVLFAVLRRWPAQPAGPG